MRSAATRAGGFGRAKQNLGSGLAECGLHLLAEVGVLVLDVDGGSDARGSVTRGSPMDWRGGFA